VLIDKKLMFSYGYIPPDKAFRLLCLLLLHVLLFLIHHFHILKMQSFLYIELSTTNNMETTGIMKFQNRTDKSIRLLAFLEAKEGHGKELKEILLEVVEPTRREPANIAYV
jgi:hypothetical protein